MISVRDHQIEQERDGSFGVVSVKELFGGDHPNLNPKGCRGGEVKKNVCAWFHPAEMRSRNANCRSRIGNQKVVAFQRD